MIDKAIEIEIEKVIKKVQAINGDFLSPNTTKLKEAKALPNDEEIKEMFTTEHFHYDRGRYYKVRLDRIQGAKILRDKIRQQYKQDNKI